MDLTHSENIVLRNILSDPAYIELAKPDFFKNDSFKTLVEVSKDFWEKYKQSPSKDQLKESLKISGKNE